MRLHNVRIGCDVAGVVNEWVTWGFNYIKKKSRNEIYKFFSKYNLELKTVK